MRNREGYRPPQPNQPKKPETSGFLGSIKRLIPKEILLPFMLSSALHMGAAEAGRQIDQRVQIENLEQKREAIKDKLFLAKDKQELKSWILNQTGVTSIEELEKNPEVLNKIDFGHFFLQTEFIDGKLEAEDSLLAFNELERKRQVFKELSEKVSDKRYVMQEILNEIADPQIFDDNKIKKGIDKNDYKSSETLLSEYLLHGKSNCYGSTRAFLAIAGDVYPETKIGLQFLHEHIRSTFRYDDSEYIAETGTGIRKQTKKTLDQTGTIENARLAFLSDFDTHAQMTTHGVDDNVIDQIKNMAHNATKSDDAYHNTKLGNYAFPDLKSNFRKLSPGEVPKQADRARVDFDPNIAQQEDLPTNNFERKHDDQPQKVQQVEPTRQQKAVRQKLNAAILKTPTTAEKKFFKQDQEKQAKKDIQPDLQENKDKDKKREIKFGVYEAQTQLPALIREILKEDDKDKKAELKKHVSKYFDELKKTGELEKFEEKQKLYIEKLNLEDNVDYSDNVFVQSELDTLKMLQDYLKSSEEIVKKYRVKAIIEAAKQAVHNKTLVFKDITLGQLGETDEELKDKKYEYTKTDIADITDTFATIFVEKQKGTHLEHLDIQNEEHLKAAIPVLAKHGIKVRNINISTKQTTPEFLSSLEKVAKDARTFRWDNVPLGTDLSGIKHIIKDGMFVSNPHERMNGITHLSYVDRYDWIVKSIPLSNDDNDKNYLTARMNLAFYNNIEINQKGHLIEYRFGSLEYLDIGYSQQDLADQIKRQFKFLGEDRDGAKIDVKINGMNNLNVPELLKDLGTQITADVTFNFESCNLSFKNSENNSEGVNNLDISLLKGTKITDWGEIKDSNILFYFDTEQKNKMIIELPQDFVDNNDIYITNVTKVNLDLLSRVLKNKPDLRLSLGTDNLDNILLNIDSELIFSHMSHTMTLEISENFMIPGKPLNYDYYIRSLIKPKNIDIKIGKIVLPSATDIRKGLSTNERNKIYEKRLDGIKKLEKQLILLQQHFPDSTINFIDHEGEQLFLDPTPTNQPDNEVNPKLDTSDLGR